MDGFLALDLWDMVIEVQRSNNNNVQPNHNDIRETCATLHSKTKTQNIKIMQKVDQLSDVDGQEDGPQGRSITGGSGPSRVPNLRVYKHPFGRVGTRGERRGGGRAN